MMRLTILFAIIGLLTTSCVSRLKVVQGSFTGFKEKILADKSSKDARIMIVHGIGFKPEDYADKFVSRLALSLDKNAKKPIAVNRIDLGVDSGFIIVKKYMVGNGKTVRFFIVNWSDVTKEYKQWLFENEENNRLKPVFVNRKLKENIMLEKFSDFVYYAGNLKDEIRYPVKACMQLMYLDESRFDSFYSIKNDSTLLNSLYSDEVSDRNIYLVTGSIGSKITLDVLSSYKDSHVGEKCDKVLCELFYKNLKGIYMLSHQVPLLSSFYLDKDKFNDTAKLRDYYVYQNYFGICNFLRNQPQKDTIDYVAFNDPNDFLGFVFLKEKPKCLDTNTGESCTECEQIQGRINKVVCNAHNTGQFMGLISNFDKAHTKIYNNKKLIRILTNGVKNGRVIKH